MKFEIQFESLTVRKLVICTKSNLSFAMVETFKNNADGPFEVWTSLGLGKPNHYSYLCSATTWSGIVKKGGSSIYFICTIISIPSARFRRCWEQSILHSGSDHCLEFLLFSLNSLLEKHYLLRLVISSHTFFPAVRL